MAKRLPDPDYPFSISVVLVAPPLEASGLAPYLLLMAGYHGGLPSYRRMELDPEAQRQIEALPRPGPRWRRPW